MSVINAFPSSTDFSIGDEAVFNFGVPKQIGTKSLNGFYSSDESPVTVTISGITAFPAAIILCFHIVSASGESYFGFFNQNNGNPTIRPEVSNYDAVVFLPKMKESTESSDKAYYPNIVIGSSGSSLDYAAALEKNGNNFVLSLPIYGPGCTVDMDIRVFAWGYAD